MIRASLLMLATTTIAGAEPFSSADARSFLPAEAGTQALVADVAFLSDADRQVVATLKDAVPYYGALALTPSEGLYVEWANAASQFHTRASARAAAMAHCEASKAQGSEPCVVVLEIVPAGAGEALTLSASAMAAFAGVFQSLGTPRAFAVSEATGGFGYAQGEAEAIAACAATNGGPSDCRVVVAD